MYMSAETVHSGLNSDAFRRYSEPLTVRWNLYAWYESVLPLLPEGRYKRIFNEHAESTITIGNCEQPLEEAIQLLKTVRLKNEVFFTPEPPSELTDFYIQLAEKDRTMRFRVYENGEFSVIVASDTPVPEVIWDSGHFKTSARPEQLLVILPDIPEAETPGGRKRSIYRMMGEFFLSGHCVTKIVTKQKYPGNFGEEFMWKHRTAKVRDRSGNIAPLLPDESLLNMDQYIAMALFEIREVSFAGGMPLTDAADHARMITSGILSPSKAFTLYYPDVTGCKRKVEIECGPKYSSYGAFITEQVLPIFEVDAYGAAPRTVGAQNV
jgi:hypothetical protein